MRRYPDNIEKAVGGELIKEQDSSNVALQAVGNSKIVEVKFKGRMEGDRYFIDKCNETCLLKKTGVSLCDEQVL